ncbi:hypothetical protein D3C81_939390 [compost metagenome]
MFYCTCCDRSIGKQLSGEGLSRTHRQRTTPACGIAIPKINQTSCRCHIPGAVRRPEEGRLGSQLPGFIEFMDSIQSCGLILGITSWQTKPRTVIHSNRSFEFIGFIAHFNNCCSIFCFTTHQIIFRQHIGIGTEIVLDYRSQGIFICF